MRIVNLHDATIYGNSAETILIEKDALGELISELHLSSLHFLSFLDHIPFNESSHPESLICLYNVDGHWGFDYSEITRLQEFLDQLREVGPRLEAFKLPSYEALVHICHSALQNNNRLFIAIE